MLFRSAAPSGRNTMSLKLAALVLLLALAWPSPPASAAAPPPALGDEAGLGDLVRYAMRHSPELETRYQQWRAPWRGCRRRAPSRSHS
jgi:hypothetical protein